MQFNILCDQIFRLKKHCFAVVLAALIVAAAKTAAAHYLWLEAIPGDTDRPAQIDIDIRVGDGYPGQQLANNLRHYEAFTVYHNGQPLDVEGHKGRKPAGWIDDDGQAVLTYYRSVARKVSMGSVEFTDYLEAEGLRQALDYHRQQGQPADITETFVHHAVLLVDGPGGYQVTGFPDNALLLLPETDGLSPGQDDAKQFRVSFAGKPLAGVPVTLSCPGQALAEQRVYSSAQGWASFERLCHGNSLLRSIYLQATDDSGSSWKSHWITLSLHQRR